MNRNTIYDLEKKGSFPSCDKLSKIADYLEVSTDYLLGREKLPEDAKTPPSEDEGVRLYNLLDIEDKAEIRGTMKHMLLSDKYSAKEKLKNA